MKERMKKKLNLFSLNEKTMKYVKGGIPGCCCACAYADSGGSSIADNARANIEGNLRSPQCYQDKD